MAETLVDNQVCTDCGTEIRTAALFCYHCGTAVTEIEKPHRNNSTSKFETKTESKGIIVDDDFTNRIGIDQVEDDRSTVDESKQNSKTNGTGNRKLRSAASIRNKTRRREHKKVEIYWEEHENAPNKWFIGVSIAIVLFTTVILLIAMYLK